MRSRVRRALPIVLWSLAASVAAAQNLTIKPELIEAQKEWSPKNPRPGGTQPEDWRYKLADGVTTKNIRYYSDGTACHGKMFFPKGFDTSKKYPAVIVAHGTNGISIAALEKYCNRFAEYGLVAMAIDYRGYGYSDGWVNLAEKDTTTDDQPLTEKVASVVIKRTRLLNHKQFEDYRAAISFLQGEPGVDPDRIGIWGSSLSGGTVLAVAGADARVKAAVAQVPAAPGSVALPGQASGGRGGAARGGRGGGRGGVNQDAVQRARTGQGGERDGGFSIKTKVDVESGELRTGELVAQMPKTTAVLFLPADQDELVGRGPNGASRFLEAQGNPVAVVVLPHTTHFQAYTGPAWEMSSTLAAEWFAHHLKK